MNTGRTNEPKDSSEVEWNYFKIMGSVAGLDLNDKGLLDTPERASKAWQHLTSGYSMDVDTIVNNAIFEEVYDEMVLVKDIEFYSLCEHHLLPFFGRCHVGYVPNNRIIGLSKIPRIVDMFSHRLQVQERLTKQIASCIEDLLDPKGVAVIMEARHLCVQMRGVQKQSATMKTNAMYGVFRNHAEARQEFLASL